MRIWNTEMQEWDKAKHRKRDQRESEEVELLREKGNGMCILWDNWVRDRYVISHSASLDSKVNTVKVLLLMLNSPIDTQTQFPLSVRTVEVTDCRLVNGGGQRTEWGEELVWELQVQWESYISTRLEEGLLPASVGPSKEAPALRHFDPQATLTQVIIVFPHIQPVAHGLSQGKGGPTVAFHHKYVGARITLIMQMSKFL